MALRSNGSRGIKLHAICKSQGRPLDLFVSARQVNDYMGAQALRNSQPKIQLPLGDPSQHCQVAALDAAERHFQAQLPRQSGLGLHRAVCLR